jgi:CubicO group peptidase (beta-lactamase class C family)
MPANLPTKLRRNLKESPSMNRRNAALLLVAVSATLFSSARAQTTEPDRAKRVAAVLPELDKVYTELAAAEHLPGLVVGVVLDGKLVYSRSYGAANLERKLPASTSTAFRIASMTKSFVAMAALKLRDEARLGLDDPLVDYLPELRQVALPTTDSPALTIRHLMTMTTGLPEDNPWGDRQMGITNADLERFVGAGLSFSNAPGVDFEYSNLGFVLLGKIVSKVSGMRFQDYITRAILQPLGMKDTRWEYAGVNADKLALGYRREHGTWQLEPMLHDGDGAAMGGLITTMDDFARYVAFQLDASPPRSTMDTGPLKRASVREMQQPRVFAGMAKKATLVDGKTPNPKVTFYGYGLNWTRDAANVVTVGHAGGLPGFGSQFRFAPQHGIGVIAFSNLRYAPVYAPTAKALDLLIERAGLAPRAVAVSSILATRQRQVAQLIESWDPALGAAITADNFFLDRSRDDWMANTRAQLASIGNITTVGQLTADNALRGSFPLVGEHGTLEVSFTLTPEREPKVQYLDIKPAAASKP